MIRLFQAVGSVAEAAFNLVEVGLTAAWNAAQPLRDVLSGLASVIGGEVVVALDDMAKGLTVVLNLLTPVLNGLASVLGSQGAISGAQGLGTVAGLGPGGGLAGTIAQPGATALASALAPTVPTYAAPTSKGAGGVQITIGGATVNGTGMSKEEVLATLNQHTDYQMRQVQNSVLLGQNL